MAEARERRPTAPDGVLVVDKPAGWTSHDVVAKVRWLAGTRKVGHAGTLDPMATGVLVLGIGRATKLLTFVVGADKEYLATIRLGAATTTDDAEGEILSTADASAVTRAQVDERVAGLTGAIEQVPSSVSAIKIDGQRAYARVRAGEDVVLAPRPVTVSTFEVRDMRPAGGATGCVDLDVRVVCSSGTYIRALARDLGEGLGVGGHLTALRRTRVGGYTLDAARTLEELAETPADVPVEVMAFADAARAALPTVDVDANQVGELSHGRRVTLAEGSPTGTVTRPVAAVGPDGSLVALLVTRGRQAQPSVVFATR